MALGKQLWCKEVLLDVECVLAISNDHHFFSEDVL